MFERRFILDTDIGPDCDDAAALALACIYAMHQPIKLLAVMHCTTSPWGAGAIRAIADWYGMTDLPVGTLVSEDEFLQGEQYERYNRPLALGLSEKRRMAEDCLPMYRRLLAAQPDGSVEIVSIGPLRNLANLLRSQPDDNSPLGGRELIARKVSRLTLMAGEFGQDNPRPEWNIEMDVAAARLVAAQWPSEMVYCGFEVGLQVNILSEPNQLNVDNPVRQAYHMHSGVSGRYSWDPCTVQWAMSEADAELYASSGAGVIEIDDYGVSRWRSVPGGKHSYLMLKAKPEHVASRLEQTLYEEDGRSHAK